MKKAMLITVGTGRSGQDIAGAICYSIERERPDRVIFLKTTRSEETTMPHIRSNPALEGIVVDEVIIDDENDVQAITRQCEEEVKALQSSGYSPSDIVVDFTSGTKAMSAALTLAAINTRSGTLVYISGERGQDGRVIPGTEKSISVRPNRMMAESLFDEAVGLFNGYQFDACVETLKKATELYQSGEFLEKCEMLKTLAEGYGLWDRFDLIGAFSVFEKIDERDIPAHWNIARQFKLNKQALYREKETLFREERAVDLLENAKRRGDTEKKYDDAVARLYRLCEYVAQFRLYQKGMYRGEGDKVDTSDVNLEQVSPGIREKYMVYKSEKDNKVKLPLYASFELLADLGDGVGQSFIDDEKLSKKLLQVRNNSILAHGFTPISPQTYSEMMECLERLLERNIENVTRIRSKVTFPKIGGYA